MLAGRVVDARGQIVAPGATSRRTLPAYAGALSATAFWPSYGLRRATNHLHPRHVSQTSLQTAFANDVAADLSFGIGTIRLRSNGRKDFLSGRWTLAQTPDTARSQPDLSTPAFGLRSR